jgi:CRP/FNR family cyclic AMP-dependent transcriptional regulator
VVTGALATPAMAGEARSEEGLDLAADWCATLAKHGHPRTFPPHAIIIHEGDAGDLLYLITEGAGKIYSTNEEGKVVIYDTFGPGDLLGESTLDGGVRSASVMTHTKTTCSVIRTRDFREMIAAHPTLAMQVIFRLIRLLRASNDHVRSLALEDVYGRVVRLLMKRALPDGEQWVIREKLTQQTIADHVGSSRERVSRIIRDLEGGGYLSIRKGFIVIERKPPPGW